MVERNPLHAFAQRICTQATGNEVTVTLKRRDFLTGE
jgi:hypothetical protein